MTNWACKTLAINWLVLCHWDGNKNYHFQYHLLHDPKIVFLDEPTGGVDPITRRQFWEMIYKAANQGTTIFVTTHYMDEAEYCDRVSIMVNGKIEALDTPKKLKNSLKLKR